jgi:hypothetical protein
MGPPPPAPPPPPRDDEAAGGELAQEAVQLRGGGGAVHLELGQQAVEELLALQAALHPLPQQCGGGVEAEVVLGVHVQEDGLALQVRRQHLVGDGVAAYGFHHRFGQGMPAGLRALPVPVGMA